MRELLIIISIFRAEASSQGIYFPDSVSIEYAKLGVDTLGIATRFYGDTWQIKISNYVESDIIDTVVYHEIGHVLGLDHCKGRSIMNNASIVPLSSRDKKLFFDKIKKLKSL